jgi:hypothetical protein
MARGGWVDLDPVDHRQLMHDCLEDLERCGQHGMSRGDVQVFLRHWWDQVRS